MGSITRNHKQDAVYWGTPSPDGFGGATFASPIEITVRWEDSNIQFMSPDGNVELSKAVIFAGQDVVIGGWIFLGTLDEVGSANQDDPQLVDGASEIRAFNKTPNIKGTDFEREIII
jgi:hypothetical protein